MTAVAAVLYTGRGVKSTPIAKGENSGDGDRGMFAVVGIFCELSCILWIVVAVSYLHLLSSHLCRRYFFSLKFNVASSCS